MTDDEIRQEGEDAIGHPGKFEGSPRYVPYFWNSDQATTEDGAIRRFCVTPIDARIFPELKEGHWVILREDDQGFVDEERA